MIGIVVGTIAIVLVSIGAGYMMFKRGRGLPGPDDFAPKQRAAIPHAPGEAPETALRARPGSQRCPSCQRALTLEREDRVTYGDKNLLVLTFRCPACDSKRALYVELSD